MEIDLKQHLCDSRNKAPYNVHDNCCQCNNSKWRKEKKQFSTLRMKYTPKMMRSYPMCGLKWSKYSSLYCVCMVFFSRLHRNKKSFLLRHSVSRLSSSLIPKRIPCFLVVTCHRIPWIPFDSMLFVFFLLQHLLCVIIWVVLLNIYARYCCGCLFSAFHISYQCKECTWKSSINQIAHRKMCTHTHTDTSDTLRLNWNEIRGSHWHAYQI